MRKIEKEEVQFEHTVTFNDFILQEQVSYQDPDKKQYHLCIVNLVIG